MVSNLSESEPINAMELKYLGVRSTQPIDELDTFPAPAGLGRVTMTSDELTALCPVTGQPDFYVVTIDYEPGPLCIELKKPQALPLALPRPRGVLRATGCRYPRQSCGDDPAEDLRDQADPKSTRRHHH